MNHFTAGFLSVSQAKNGSTKPRRGALRSTPQKSDEFADRRKGCPYALRMTGFCKPVGANCVRPQTDKENSPSHGCAVPAPSWRARKAVCYKIIGIVSNSFQNPLHLLAEFLSAWCRHAAQLQSFLTLHLPHTVQTARRH